MGGPENPAYWLLDQLGSSLSGGGGDDLSNACGEAHNFAVEALASILQSAYCGLSLAAAFCLLDARDDGQAGYSWHGLECTGIWTVGAFVGGEGLQRHGRLRVLPLFFDVPPQVDPLRPTAWMRTCCGFTVPLAASKIDRFC